MSPAPDLPRGVAVLVALLLVVLPAAHSAADDPEPEPGPTLSNQAPPRVVGETTYGKRLRAERGTWLHSDPEAELRFTYRWLRDGERVRGAREQTYRPGLDDLRHRLAVEVTAHDEQGARARAVSEETGPVRRADLEPRSAPRVLGTQRFGRVLRGDAGRWSSRPTRVRWTWLRDGEPVAGARARSRAVAPGDVGHRLRVQVRVDASGHRPATATSPVTAPVRHRVDLRRTVAYSIATRGRTTTPVRDFARLAQQTFDDPRGWRGAGVGFRRVAEGGAFTLVLAEAATLPSFHPVCSTQYSCRVGRYVVINQDRWRTATAPWNAAGGSLRDYRHMVVNHETGHWLGLGHGSCPGAGQPAPVMQQQSKGLGGCRFNPWPLAGERDRV
ncbi:hypothetical protein BKA08_002344 [Nocardioides marinisabuli]|uniref:DUF3152 domain-containing protein n=1 Tax=Nocardioides marinisabuli TaxID=419476 RepID=A0A7Y9F2D8_9ACTN|nr:DUF3152 domain-containing protein [Nocardioides marinisabuli]NYD58106.1 hypothetical protein [Nocardioides marinisabuli]